MKPIPSVVLALLLVLAPVAAAADVPRTLTYQGVLTNADGTPREGQTSIGIELVVADVGIFTAWEELFFVDVQAGLFEVRLGSSANPLPTTLIDGFEDRLFLQISIDGETLAPMQPLRSVLFAVKADDARTLGGVPAFEYALDRDVASVAASVNGIGSNPVLDLEGLVSPGPGNTVIVDGEAFLQGGNVPLSVNGGIVGINVQGASQEGIRADTLDPTGSGVGGLFTHSGPTSVLGVGAIARGNQGAAPDLVLGANSGSGAGDNGVIASDPAFASSDVIVQSNDDVAVKLDRDGSGEDANFLVQDSADRVLFNVDEDGTVLAPKLDPGDGLARSAAFFPIALGRIDESGQSLGTVNITAIKKPHIGEWSFTIPGQEGPKFCGGNNDDAYVIHATPQNSNIISAQVECDANKKALFVVQLRDTAGFFRDSRITVVVYRVPN